MSNPDVQLKIRLSAELKRRLEEAAERNNRSLTAEVVARLSSSFQDVERLLLDNRQRESALIDRELEETEWVLGKLEQVVPLSDPKYQQHRQYFERLMRYRALITNGLQYIEDARHAPVSDDMTAEIREFPTGKKAPG